MNCIGSDVAQVFIVFVGIVPIDIACSELVVQRLLVPSVLLQEKL